MVTVETKAQIVITLSIEEAKELESILLNTYKLSTLWHSLHKILLEIK
jgi:hypothetical protein